jgi:hypothetical protein
MTTEVQNIKLETVSQISAWIMQEIASQAETLKNLNEKIDAIQNLVEASDAIDRLIVGGGNTVLLPNACVLDMTCLPPYVTNLYALEFTSDDIPYRWSGPGKTTTFTLAIDRTKEKYLEIAILGVVCPDVLADLSLQVDGTETAVDITESKITATMPSRQSNQSFTEIVLRVAATVSPNSLNGSNDQRLLGLAISRISVK